MAYREGKVQKTILLGSRDNLLLINYKNLKPLQTIIIRNPEKPDQFTHKRGGPIEKEKNKEIFYPMGPIRVWKEDFFIFTDNSKLDITAMHDFLSNHSYWGKNISLAKVITSLHNFLNFGWFHKDQPIGRARIIADFATTAYLCDVDVFPAYWERDFQMVNQTGGGPSPLAGTPKVDAFNCRCA
ncbi:MAG: hypothetical protein ACYCOO_11215 [Chitinophagaceae bacterium]